jgi:hypothetical protein
MNEVETKFPSAADSANGSVIRVELKRKLRLWLGADTFSTIQFKGGVVADINQKDSQSLTRHPTCCS